MSYTITASPPVLTPSPASITVGGTSGLDSSSQSLAFALSNQGAFTWTATVTTSSGGSWLTLSNSSGSVASGAFAILTLEVNRGAVVPGTYQGQIQLQATTNGQVLTQNIPVTFNVETNRLIANATGVAFSSFPSRSVLTRSVTVSNSWEATGVNWQAQSDQGWLTVTASGTTGTPLVLTASPTGLTAGQYTAHVTIS